MTGMRYLPGCPTPFAFAASRNVAAVFVSDQWRPHPNLLLDGGVRLQAGFGQLAYDPVLLYAGSVVWRFLNDWHFKANFSEGFRPPVFNNLMSYGGAVQFPGNLNIKSELSQAVQGEINGRVLRNYRKIRELTLRADYSYTTLDNLIIVDGGHYSNAGKRGISSAEFLARVYLKGDHNLQLGYTYLSIADERNGMLLYTPNHWFVINSSFNLLRDRVDLVNTLYVAGAAEDPNRLPHVNLSTCVPGPRNADNCGADASVADITLDRLPAVALWNIGLRWRNAFAENLELSAYVYNALDQHWYGPDALYDLSPQLQTLPYPGAGRSALVSARYRF
jgi:outer membrane receptor protein involved in Fe transport